MNDPKFQHFGTLAALTVTCVAGAAFFVGFYILPGAGTDVSVWQRMCRAAGVVATQPGGGKQRAPATLTSVVMPAAALRAGTPDEIGRGATLALRCTACHGAQGESGADAPNLAGQYSEVIYKQLVDFQRGARTDAVMGAMVVTLTDVNLLELAHYYAYLPRLEKDRSLSAAPALVRVGDPMRNIAPCAACHGSHNGKTGAPALEGEPKSYLTAQLNAFARGARRNDASALMRSEARLLTAQEIELVTDHYAGISR